jgi:hypothetical protein
VVFSALALRADLDGDDGPTVLVDLVTYWLADNRVLPVGNTTLTRPIASVRDRARRRAWQQPACY